MSDTPKTAEQQARDLLERLECPNAQRLSAGDVVELANLISDLAAEKLKRQQVEHERDSILEDLARLDATLAGR